MPTPTMLTASSRIRTTSCLQVSPSRTTTQNYTGSKSVFPTRRLPHSLTLPSRTAKHDAPPAPSIHPSTTSKTPRTATKTLGFSFSVRTEGSYRLKLSLFEVVGCVLILFISLPFPFLINSIVTPFATANPSIPLLFMSTLQKSLQAWKVGPLQPVDFVLSNTYSHSVLVLCSHVGVSDHYSIFHPIAPSSY